MALLIYCYDYGVFRRAGLSQSSCCNISSHFLTANGNLDHDMIAKPGTRMWRPDGSKKAAKGGDDDDPDSSAQVKAEKQTNLTDPAKATYQRRKSTIGPLFVVIKSILGFTRF